MTLLPFDTQVLSGLVPALSALRSLSPLTKACNVGTGKLPKPASENFCSSRVVGQD